MQQPILKLRRCPHSVAATLAVLPSMSLSQELHSTSRFAHLCRSRPRGSILAPTLVTLPSMSLIPFAPFPNSLSTATLAGFPAMTLHSSSALFGRCTLSTNTRSAARHGRRARVQDECYRSCRDAIRDSRIAIRQESKPMFDVAGDVRCREDVAQRRGYSDRSNAASHSTALTVFARLRRGKQGELIGGYRTDTNDALLLACYT